MTKCETYTLAELIKIMCERPETVLPERKDGLWVIVCKHGPTYYTLHSFHDVAQYLELWQTKGLWKKESGVYVNNKPV